MEAKNRMVLSAMDEHTSRQVFAHDVYDMLEAVADSHLLIVMWNAECRFSVLCGYIIMIHAIFMLMSHVLSRNFLSRREFSLNFEEKYHGKNFSPCHEHGQFLSHFQTYGGIYPIHSKKVSKNSTP